MKEEREFLVNEINGVRGKRKKEDEKGGEKGAAEDSKRERAWNE